MFRNFPGAKINFVPNGIPVRFEMAEKYVYKQTERQTDIFAIIIIIIIMNSIYIALFHYGTECSKRFTIQYYPDRPGINLKPSQLPGKHTVRQPI